MKLEAITNDKPNMIKPIGMLSLFGHFIFNRSPKPMTAQYKKRVSLKKSNILERPPIMGQCRMGTRMHYPAEIKWKVVEMKHKGVQK